LMQSTTECEKKKGEQPWKSRQRRKGYTRTLGGKRPGGVKASLVGRWEGFWTKGHIEQGGKGIRKEGGGVAPQKMKWGREGKEVEIISLLESGREERG